VQVTPALTVLPTCWCHYRVTTIVMQASAPLDASPSSKTPAATGAAEGLQESSTAATSSRTSTTVSSTWLESTPNLLRRVLSTSSAAEAVDLIIQQLDRQNGLHALSAADGEVLLRKSLEAGNTALALSVYQQMCAAMRAQARGTPAATSVWPVATLRHTQVLVVGLCRQSQVADALATVHAVRSQGIVGSEEVGRNCHANKYKWTATEASSGSRLLKCRNV